MEVLRSGCLGGGGAGPFPSALPLPSTDLLVAVRVDPASDAADEGDIPSLAPAIASNEVTELLIEEYCCGGTGGGVLFLLLGNFGGLFDNPL